MWCSDYPRTICAIKVTFLGENAVKLYRFKDLPVLEYMKNISE